MGKKKIDLENSYQLYLKRCKLDEKTMHPVQKKETRQAFYGGVGTIIGFMIGDDFNDYSEDEIYDIITDMSDQVKTHFENVLSKMN